MLTKKIISVICFAMLVSIGFIACKKDAFSEKDAIAAQTSLLQTKFNFDLAIKNIDLQIQRVSDSAKLAMIGLQFRADSSIERVKQSAAIAQLLQTYQNQRLLAMQADSLQRGIAMYNDQVAKAKKLWDDSLALANAGSINPATLRRNYSIVLVDYSNGMGVGGATVSVMPFGGTAVVSATTNSNGIATFTDILVDPAAYFAVAATGYSSILVREASLSSLGSVPVVVGANTISRVVRGTDPSVRIYNIASARNTIRGSVIGDIDLTNGDAGEAIAGHLITFNTTVNIGSPAMDITYQFPAVSDIAGNYSITVPDGNFTAVYANNAKVQQKLFVNAWQDEDASIAVPRIATIGATIATFGSNLPSGVGTGYYFTFPADSLTGRTVIAAVTNSQNGTFNPTLSSTLPYSNRNLGTPKTDSLIHNFSGVTSSLWLNNSTSGSHAFDNSVMWSRKSLYSPARPADTLVMTMVSLVPNWIVAPPAMRAIVDGNTGRISQFLLARTPGFPTSGPTAGAGGIFKNGLMFTATNRPAWQNLQMLNTLYLPSLASNILGVNSLTVNAFGGSSYFLPIEFRTTVQRDRTPK